MKSIKRFAKRSLSLILCLAMVMTTMIFFDWGLLKPEAAVVEKDKIAFYVPEAIYLAPNALEWTQATSTPFQFYIQDDVDSMIKNGVLDLSSTPTVKSTPNTDKGRVYFACDQNFALNVSLTYKFLDLSGNQISGGAIDYGKYEDHRNFSGRNYDYIDFTGKSPSLAAGVQGCYIEWILAYDLVETGERKYVYAYTYVYKPYTQTYGGVVWLRNEYYNDHMARQITWVSGVHSTSAATEEHNDWAYPKFSADRGMAAFLSTSNVAYAGDTRYEGVISRNVHKTDSRVTQNAATALGNNNVFVYHPDANDMYAAFAATGYFDDTWCTDDSIGLGEGPGNKDCWDWFQKTSSPTQTYATNTYDHYAGGKDGGTDDWNLYLNASSGGSIFIDTSRYTNLSQIPNLGVGLMVTDQDSSQKGAWYVADITEARTWGTNFYEETTNRSYFYENDDNVDGKITGIVMARAGGMSSGQMRESDAVGHYEGRKYSGTWLRPIKSGTSVTYKVKGYYANCDEKDWKGNNNDYAGTNVVVSLKATQTDKSALRTAVYNAIKEFGTLGVRENFDSYYYDTQSTEWSTFVSAYKTACRELTKLDGAPNANSAENLNNAVKALKDGKAKRYYFDVNYGNINPNLFVLRDTFTSGGLTFTVDHKKDNINVNGSVSTTTHFYKVDFTPTAGGDYYMSYIKNSGSFSGSNCTSVLELFNYNRNQYNPRIHKDVNNNTVSAVFSVPNEQPMKHSMIYWYVWSGGGTATFNNLNFKVKLEKGGSQTAYSPAGRVSSNGAYSTLPADPTREGYIFAGWYTTQDCSGSRVTTETAITSDVLYAKWVANSEVMFGNEFNFEKEFADIDDDEVIIDYIANSVTMTAKPVEGQENDEKQTGFLAPLVLIPGHSYRVTSDLTVIDDSDGATDKASGQVHICFTPNGEQAELEVSKLKDNYNNPLYYLDAKSSVVAEGNVATLNGVFTVPDEKPYVHLNFDVNLAEGGNVTGKITNIYVYDITSPEGVADDLSEPKDSNGNKVIFISGAPGDQITTDEVPTPKRSGYNFVGWSTERDATTGVAKPDKKVNFPVNLPAGVTTLYSLWEPKTYTIKFDPNGGEGTMADFTVYYDEPANLPANTLTRENCIFKGWSVSPNAGYGGIYADKGLVDVKNLYPDENNVITLYAQWDIEGEVIFGNEFDFDRYVWRNFSHSTGFVDYALNTVTLTSETSDAYTNDYDRSDQSGMMNLIPGRTYEFSCVAKNLTEEDKTVKAQMYLFTFESENLDEENIGSNGVDFTDVTVDLAKGATGTISKTLTLDEGNKYATIRVGIRTADATVEFSEICVRDITNFASEPETDSVTKADPSSINYEPGTTVDLLTAEGIPTLTRPGYTFAGWSKTKNMTTGNGEDVVKLVTMPDTQNVKTNNVKLYPVWIPNFIIVRMNLYSSTVDQKFFFGEEQALTKVTETPETDVLFYDGEEKLGSLSVGMKFVYWSEIVEGNRLYDDAQLVTNPGGADRYKTASEKIYDLYAVWDVADNATITAPFYPKKTNDANNYVLKGWAKTQGSSEVEYEVGDEIKPEKGSKFYAVWHELPITETKIEKFEEDYKGKDAVVTVVSGIEIGADGVENAAEIKESSDKFNTSEFDTAKSEYEAKKSAYESKKNAETNNALLGAIGNVESSAAKVPAEEAVIDYLGKFKIKYKDGVEGKVKEGTYSVADMNLNHYTKEELDKVSTEWGTARTYTTETNQVTINESVVKLAKAFANPQKVESTPTYNVYDADTSLPTDLAARVDESKGETAGVSYVYTGKGNYTYYCYTNSKNPKLFIAVNEATSGNARVCYPTNAIVEKAVTTQSATANADVIQVTVDNPADYSSYFTKGMGTTRGEDYYNKKDVVVLSPQFGVNDDKATVTYTFKAYDDAYAPLIDGKDLSGKDAKVPDPDYLNYADSSKLASGAGSGNLADIPNTNNAVTPENTITIIIDYHPGDTMNVKGKQVGNDQWLKQYHLERTSGGASNWELPMPNDGVYTVNDSTYGQTNRGSFTYTFELGETDDFANCVLGLSGAENFDANGNLDVNKVIEKFKDDESYKEISKVAFDGAQELWKWGTNPATNKYEYYCTHRAGTGLGFKAWPNTNWSFNYYPKSEAYTYVHIVDRWGNTVDKVIQVPNLDGSATQLHTNTVGTVEVIETGGSGIDTMSFSAQSFDIITDENSIFDGETYTTSGNTIKVYTGEANKKYTLEANDVATNKTTANVTTDAEGYLTITVEDKAFNNDGMYTFSLNGKQINLYGEIETEPEEPTKGVTNVEYTPSTSTRNEFMFTVLGRPDKIQVIEPDGGTRTYDRYHVNVIIVSYDENGNIVGAMSRELSYEVWTIEMNVPADIELTAIARYGREWSKDAPYKYTVILATPEFDDEVYSMSLAATEGKQGKVAATVVTGLDVQGVRFVMDNNTTATYYQSTEVDGKRTYNGYAWMNHEGENIIIVKIRVNNAWLNAGELNYNAI